MEVFIFGPLELVGILVLMVFFLDRETLNLPKRIVREEGFDESIKEIQRNTQVDIVLFETPARPPGKVWLSGT